MAEQSRRALYLSADRHWVDGVERPNPADLFTRPAADVVRDIFRMVFGNGVVFIDPTAAAAMGLPTGELAMGDAAKGHPFAAEIRRSGFMLKEVFRWFRVTTRTMPGDGVWFGLTEFIDPAYCDILDEDPRVTSAAADEWHRITGHVWQGSSADAGNDILRAQRYRAERRGPELKPEFWSWEGPADDPAELAYQPQDWQRRDPAVTEAHGYDRVRAYLSAMTTVEVAGEPLQHTGLKEFDPKQAGWYLCDLDPWRYADRMPDPAGYNGDEDDEGIPARTVWLAHPTVELLSKLGPDLYGFSVLDSWTAPATPVMKQYGTQLRKVWDVAGAISDKAVRAAVRRGVKGAYRQGHGNWRSRKSTVQRPDWAGAVVAQSRANLWRKVWAAGQASGVWPLFVDTDNVYFPAAVEPEGWTVWDGDRADLDDVAKLGHWRTTKIKRRRAKSATAATVESGQ